LRVYVATSNAGKLREIESILGSAGFELSTYADYVSPIEGDRSYAENAALKARALSAQLQRAGRVANVVADDSGLEVFALDHRPGVLTAYYGGLHATWPERRRRLLDELGAVGGVDRRARFVCAMHFIDENGREFASMGTVDGVISTQERGEDGFSFDPIFIYPPVAKTFAELSESEKNRISHRAIAAAALVAAVRASGLGVAT
jgi:XTP/dITP diphosphohydrolase